MLQKSTLSQWLARLETLAPTEVNLGLERVNTMLDRLALPMPEKILLIAGTNGKGSSVAMSAALLQAAGLKVGAYTSPHIEHYNERIVVNGSPVSDAVIVAAFEHIEAQRGDLELTYFEYGTLAAFVVFATQGLDVWILEVGLGGRLDATNAITPDASLITNISLDHCDWLGDNVGAIAIEKAGVMRAETATIIGDANAPDVLDSRAEEIGARALRAGRDFHVAQNGEDRWQWHSGSDSFTDLRLPGLSGDFQVANAGAVIALLMAAGYGNKLSQALINRVLPDVHLAGRSQRLRAGGVNYLIDVAHNPAAAAALAASLGNSDVPGESGQTIAILGVLNDKDIDGILHPIIPQVDRWIAVTPASARALAAADTAQRIANLTDQPCLICGEISEAIEFAQRVAVENDRILVTGSFFTVGPALRFLQSKDLSDT